MTLQEEHESLLEFLYLCPVGLIRTNLAGDVRMLNPKAAQLLLPITRNSSTLDNLFDALQDHAPELRNLVSAYAAERGTVCEHHLAEIRAGATGVEAVLALTVIKLAFGELMTVVQDVTKLVETERALRSREQRLDAIFNGVRDYAIYSLDEEGRIETWNKSAERVEGFSSQEAIGHSYGVDYPLEKRDPVQISAMLKRAACEGWHEEEGWRVRGDGARFWANTMVSVLRESEKVNSRAQGFSVITRDITERKRTEDVLRRLASTDYLTGAYNRRYFFETAPAEVASRLAEGKPSSVIVIDADHFKQLNDTRGHEVGDRVLKTLATVCMSAVAESGIVARFGGEEFAIVLLAAPEATALELAEKIRRSVEDSGMGCTISLGVAEVESDLEDALRAADRALYRAKEQGRNRVIAARN